MAQTFNTPKNSPTVNFNRNMHSPIAAFDNTAAMPAVMPESGTVPIQHATPVHSPTISFGVNTHSPIRAYR